MKRDGTSRAPRQLVIDVETRSRADLRTVGAHRYASDPTTEILCVAFAVDDEPVQLWKPGEAAPTKTIKAADIIVAHNAAFERAILRHVLGPRHGWPEIPVAKWRCTMARAYAMALPGSLEKVAAALELPQQKDTAGAKAMQTLSKPDRHGDWVEEPELLEQLFDYCRQDVETERALYAVLPQLTEDEQRLWELDQVINERGFHVDGELLEAARGVLAASEERLLAEFRALAEPLENPAQVVKLIAWLAERGCEVPDLKKGTISHALRRKGLAPEVRRVLELRRELAHASAAKIEALRAWRMDDGRVRGTFQYHGAATGRWVGRGPQPQNFRREGDRIAEKIAAILAGGDGLASPIEAVGDIARAMISAAPGRRLTAADFIGVESRVLAWIAGERNKFALWSKFDRTQDPADDPYVVIGRAAGHPEETARAAGKIADLAFGYQGGTGAYRNFAPEDDASTEAEIKRFRDRWRNAHPATVRFWSAIDRAAIRAVRRPDTEHSVGRLTFRFKPPFLKITLPQGRSLSYPFPEIKQNRFGHPCVMFKDSAGGKFTDCKFGHGAYGGLFTENIVSGIARDLLAEALKRLEAAGYPVVLHVHDEVVCEVPDGFGELEEFRSIVEEAPAWAKGLPIAVKVRAAARFSKDDNGAASAPPSESDDRGDDDDDDDDDDEELGEDELRFELDEEPEQPAEAPEADAAEAGAAEEPRAAEADAPLETDASEEQEEQAEAPRSNGQDKPGKNGNGSRVIVKRFCPFHDDRGTPNLFLFDDGHFHCFAPQCGAHGDIADLPPETANGPQGKGANDNRPFKDRELRAQGFELAHEFVIALPDGTELFREARYEHKERRGGPRNKPAKELRAYRVVGKKKIAGAGDDRMIYNAGAIACARRGSLVLIPEGGLKAKRLIERGLLATYAPFNAWTTESAEPLRGLHVAYLQDNDAAGDINAGKARSALAPNAASFRVVPASHLWKSLPASQAGDLREKDGVEDWLALGGDAAMLEEICREILPDGARLAFIDMSRWDFELAPEQEWAVFNRIPRRECILFSGEGGAGKSILQLQHCCASTLVEREWLGVVPEHGPTIFIDAEDDEKVLHRRTKAIADHYEASIAELIRNGLHLVSWRGVDATLAVPERSGKMEPTQLYRQLLEAAGDIKPIMIGIAASANVFAGNENDRAQVQQFIGMLTRVAMTANGSIALISHPSLAGINTETGLSGSTQWHNSVRARQFLRGVKPEEGEPRDTDLREIVFKKNNYGPMSESIILRWTDGLFLPVAGANVDQVAKHAIAQEVFVSLLERFRKQNRFVGSSPSRNYAPAAFAVEDEARRAGLSKTDLEHAMRALFQEGRIWNEPCGKPSRPSYRIAVK